MVPGLLSHSLLLGIFSSMNLNPLLRGRTPPLRDMRALGGLSTLLPWLGRNLTTRVLPAECPTLAFVPEEDQFAESDAAE